MFSSTSAEYGAAKHMRHDTKRRQSVVPIKTGLVSFENKWEKDMLGRMDSSYQA